jgi:hypothetical protein
MVLVLVAFVALATMKGESRCKKRVKWTDFSGFLQMENRQNGVVRAKNLRSPCAGELLITRLDGGKADLDEVQREEEFVGQQRRLSTAIFLTAFLIQNPPSWIRGNLETLHQPRSPSGDLKDSVVW